MSRSRIRRRLRPTLRTPRWPGLAAPAAGLAAVVCALVCALGLVVPPTASAQTLETLPLPPGAREAAATIDTHTLASPVRFLASDLLEGRGPATRGDRLARAYLATQMEFLGLAPGGADGSWIQPFEIVGLTAELPATWSFEKGDESRAFAAREQWVAFSGVQEPRAEIQDAELVFVGYGIQAPEHDWDDYKGADLAGKVLVMLNNDPDWDPELFEGERRLYYGRWTYKYESAARQGAAGAIIVHTTPSAGYPWQVVETSWTGPQYELPDRGEPRIEIGAWLAEGASRELMELAGRDLDELTAAAKRRDFRPVPLGIATSLRLDNRVERVETANVLGLLRGRDPELADEAVVYTAHHDHLGVGEEKDGDAIYNGALDNGAGMAQVLAIARAFTALPEPPRRSVLFLFVAAEEQGLLGSEHYAAHPTFPPGKIAANVNYDGGNM